ncbi:hypothetical protein [Archangium sp.]|uniref:hypothetical protein n=1 Tax=Archangium sp. TaxID=1872627 RepID=UPI002D763DD1|nr:hypothetical protein [Archangium sp.]HYO57782.1 hypothetical protein [Archangium sp.]
MKALTRLIALLMLASCGETVPEADPLPDNVGAHTQALTGATVLLTESSLSTGDLANVSSCIAEGRLWAHNSAAWDANRARIFERTVTLEANQSILIEGHLNLVSAAHPAIGVTAQLGINGNYETFFGENHVGKEKGTTHVCNDLSDEPNSTLSLHGARVYTAPSAGTYTITLAAVAYQSNAPAWTGACPNGQAKTVPCKHDLSCTLTNENAYLAVATGSSSSFLRVYTLNTAPAQWMVNWCSDQLTTECTPLQTYNAGSISTFTHGTYTVPTGVTQASFYSQSGIDCDSTYNCTAASGATANVRTRLCAGSTSYCTAWTSYSKINQNKHHKSFNNLVDWTNKVLMPLTRPVTPGEQLSIFSQIEVDSSGQPAKSNPSARSYYAFAYTCMPETDTDFCGRHGKNCGLYTNIDNCGVSRTANCGTCSSPETCGYGGIANRCGKCDFSLGYVDADGDGYGAGAYGCQPGNIVQNNMDCCDSDNRAYPGTTVGYSSTNNCGSWDYNCNGTITATNANSHYTYNTGGLAASYSNGSTCTKGNYAGFYRTPSVSVTPASCGTNVKIQPCNWYYYSNTNCTGLIGYHYCTDRLVLCN